MNKSITKISGSFDFSTNDEINKQICELEKIISFERENIYEVLSRSSMNGNILDLGCGPGSTTEIIASYNNCIHVTGVDREPRFIEYANKKTTCQKIQYIVGDCYSLPFEDNTFDCCYARYVFQHLMFPVKALHEIKRVVKSDGIIGIHDFDYELLKITPQISELRKIQRFNSMVKAFSGGDAFVGRKLAGYLEDAGVKNVSTLFTYTNNIKNKEFMTLFYNSELNNKEYLVNNKVLSEDEYNQLTSSILSFISNDESFFEIGNYYVYGVNSK